jgi:hypothetical protein
MRNIVGGKIIDVQGDRPILKLWEEELNTIYRGVAKVIDVSFKDAETKDPEDLTGATIDCELQTLALDLSDGVAVIGNALLGKARITIAASASTGLTLGRDVLTGEVLRSGKDPIVFEADVEIADLPV